MINSRPINLPLHYTFGNGENTKNSIERDNNRAKREEKKGADHPFFLSLHFFRLSSLNISVILFIIKLRVNRYVAITPPSSTYPEPTEPPLCASGQLRSQPSQNWYTPAIKITWRDCITFFFPCFPTFFFFYFQSRWGGLIDHSIATSCSNRPA